MKFVKNAGRLAVSEKQHIDVKIKSWGNGSSSGPWIKLDLAEEEDLDVLASQIGNGFHMILVPVDNGEEGEEQEAKALESKSYKNSQEAHFMLGQDNFTKWLCHITKKDMSSLERRDAWFKNRLKIKSKAELDNPNNKIEINEFVKIRDQFRYWVNNQYMVRS